MEDIKSLGINLICVGIIFAIFWLVKGGLIYARIDSLQEENNSLKKQIQELQKELSEDIVKNDTRDDARQAFYKSQSLVTSVKDLLGSPEKYISKKIKVGPLKVTDNNLDRKSFCTYASTGTKTTDIDYDTFIEVFYDKTKDFDSCKNLSSAKRPVIYISGTYLNLANNTGKGYIQADDIWISN